MPNAGPRPPLARAPGAAAAAPARGRKRKNETWPCTSRKGVAVLQVLQKGATRERLLCARALARLRAINSRKFLSLCVCMYARARARARARVCVISSLLVKIVFIQALETLHVSAARPSLPPYLPRVAGLAGRPSITFVRFSPLELA